MDAPMPPRETAPQAPARTVGVGKRAIGRPHGKTVGIAVLAYKARETTRQTVENHLRNGLYELFDEAVVCWQAAGRAEEALMARLGVRCVTRPENLGIQAGFRWIWETLRTDYLIVLENDFPVCVPPESMRGQFREAMARLEAGEVDLVRFRNRYNPGPQNRFAQMYSRFWPIRERDPRWADTEELDASPAWVKALRRTLRPGKALRWAGRSPYIERWPERLFPRFIRRIGPDFFAVDSWVLPWTNQATLISHELMGRLLDFADAHPSSVFVCAEGNRMQTLEPPLNRRWWRRQHFWIGVPEGVFTHSRLDR